MRRMHERIRERAEVGLRKCDLVADTYDAALRFDPKIGSGGDYPALVPLLPSGPNAASPHLTWDDESLKQGEGTFSKLSAWCIAIIVRCLARCFLANPPRHSSMLKKLFWKVWKLDLKRPRPAIFVKILQMHSLRC